MKHSFATRRLAAAWVRGAPPVLFVLLASCSAAPPARQAPTSDEAYRAARERMVASQIQARGVRDLRVLDSMRVAPRHLFVPDAVRDSAYDDTPLPIGFGQTISQPYIVALMTELARGGRMVIPVGRQDEAQWLRVIEKGQDGRVRTRDEIPVRFVPSTVVGVSHPFHFSFQPKCSAPLSMAAE
jgi:hypothetical protein